MSHVSPVHGWAKDTIPLATNATTDAARGTATAIDIRRQKALDPLATRSRVSPRSEPSNTDNAARPHSACTDAVIVSVDAGWANAQAT